MNHYYYLMEMEKERQSLEEYEWWISQQTDPGSEVTDQVQINLDSDLPEEF